jgi:hypothetical protein
MEHFAADLELKTVDVPQRIISGYACIHHTPDKVHDIIDPIASAKAVARLGSPSDVAVFIAHDTQSLPVGIPQTIQATPQGLYTETYVLKGPVGDNLLAVAKDLQEHGQSLGMSIGYKTKDSRYEQTGPSGKQKRVRRLLSYELKEYSFAASQAIAHPEALVSAVKAMLHQSAHDDEDRYVAPSASTVGNTPLSAPKADAGEGGGAWGRKTPGADGDPARAARREQARAELERCDREAQTAQAEAQLRRARHAEAAAEVDELSRYITAQQLRRADEERREREDQARRQKEMMQRLRDVADTPIPRSRRDCEEALDELGRYLDRHNEAEQHRLWKETDAALSRCIYEPGYRRRWLARHPGGVDQCSCDGCRAYRREPPR